MEVFLIRRQDVKQRRIKMTDNEPKIFTTKLCKKCGQVKEFTEFYKTTQSKDGYFRICIMCVLTKNKINRIRNPDFARRQCEKSKLWRENNPIRSRYLIRNATLQKKYGIGIEEYGLILEKQKNVCAICGSNTSKRRNDAFIVDHCHKTDKVRGLLCHKCNWGLGAFNDDVSLFEKAILYLKKGE